MDLSGYTLPELFQLQKDIDREIANRKVTDKHNLLVELQNLAAAKGFSLNEVLGIESGKKLGGKKAAVAGKAQFRNPADANQTWSGRGRKPQWALDWINAGKSIDDLRI
ncbi:DNA-binding protein H-NS [Andreprevotia lacus DSM 23236]|jgi:DNA-binding protein H-NS|uniref:DNA-binding protein H-NS n=1 Tax=Andreprevotia lacus DSM 23236 TaxID=1121001 RepID=A0A1W1Y0Q4_9NEIS|nr:H-NS histone family protein [Andreprevotia lacus]SMC29715.1 DNA-binding protein H-NS [Andreprevotia lacus DSM 23236]